MAVVIGLTMDLPGEGPDLWIDVLQQAGLVHLFFEERTGDGGEGVDGDQEVSAGGAPGRAVRGEATARNAGVEVRVVLVLPAPGRQDAGAPREVRPEATRVFGEPFEGCSRGVEHGVRREALRRADTWAEGRGDGKGDEAMRPGKLFVQVVMEPRLGCMLLTLGTVAVPTGMMDAVVSPAAWARREAVAVGAALARWDGADDLAVGSGEGGRACQGLRGKSRENIAESRHGSSPCMRAWSRS